jgi:ribose transport system permease protein
MLKILGEINSKISVSMRSLMGILVVLFIVTGLVDNYFYTFDSIGNTLQIAAPLAIFGAGQTIVMLTGGIDLSLAMTATGTIYLISVKSHEGLAVSLTWGILFCLIIGTINGISIGIFNVNPLIMTLSMSTVLIGFFSVGVSTFLKGSSSVPSLFVTMSSGYIWGPVLSWPLLVWLIVATVVMFLLTKTGLGRLIYSVGDNAKAVRLAGVKVWQVQLASYILCSFFAGLGGVILGGQSGAVSIDLATSLLLPTVAAVVIGGTSIMGGMGTYTGTIMGALILAVISYLLSALDTSEALKQIIYGSIVLALAWTYAQVSAKGKKPVGKK